MPSYTNTHVNHTDDVAKHWPVVIPWSSNWNTSTLVPAIAPIKGEFVRELRQHAKALEYNFNFVGSNPAYGNATDGHTAVGAKILRSTINQTDGALTSGGAGLLDGIETLSGANPISPISGNPTITPGVFAQMASKLQGLASYANYSNYNNAGYGQYTNYNEYSQAAYVNYSQYREYNRTIHGDNDAAPSKYTNYMRAHVDYTRNISDPGYVDGSYNNNTVAYSNVSYSNSYNNPAIYQNTL